MTEGYLPEVPGVEPGVRKGREPYEGYRRGWGLEFGGLRQSVLGDPLYQEAARVAEGRSVISESHRLNLFLLLRFYLGRIPAGHVVEFGAYKGGNAMFLASVVGQLHPGVMVHAFDTFSGMPGTDHSIDAHASGDFSDVDYEDMLAHATDNGLTNLRFHRGLFQETVPTVLGDIGKVALAHIDCDIYSAVAYCYDAVKPAMVDGGYLVFDDATVSSCLGATEAVEELVIRRDGLSAEQIYPQFVFRFPPT